MEVHVAPAGRGCRVLFGRNVAVVAVDVFNGKPHVVAEGKQPAPHKLTLPLESVPHNRGHELACLGTAASQFCSNCIGLT